MGKESNKKTAVEWFIEKLEQKGDASENVSIRRIQISIDVSDYLELKKQAKEMEKEQIKDAYFGGWHREFGNRDEDSQQYYEQTYGGNK